MGKKIKVPVGISQSICEKCGGIITTPLYMEVDEDWFEKSNQDIEIPTYCKCKKEIKNG